MSGEAAGRVWRQKVGLNRARIGGTAPYVHRFQVGILDAAIVSDGPLILPEAGRIFPDLPTATVQHALDDAFLPAGPVRAEQNCLLIDLGGHLALIDNGMGTSRDFGPHSGRLERSLGEVGLTPADIDSLVLSHAHPDHCWGTMRDDGTPAFPNAQIWMDEGELGFWERQTRLDRPTVLGVRRHLLPLRDRILFFRDGEEFLPGLHALRAPGHTPGHTAFVIASAEDELCVPGDVAFHAPLSFAHPATRSAFDLDAAEAARTRTRLLGRLADERMRVAGYHLPWPGLGHVARNGDGFRWVGESSAPGG